MRFNVYATVTGSKYLGTLEANDAEAALDKAQQDHDGESVVLCHDCTRDGVEECVITDLSVEPVNAT